MSEDLWTEVDELTLRRITVGLSEDEFEQLHELMAAAPDADGEWIERLVGELDAELSAAGDESMPSALRERLLEQTDTSVTPITARAQASVAGRGVAWLGWAAAAAMAGLMLLPGDGPPPASEGEVAVEPTVLEPADMEPTAVERALALADRPDALTIGWMATDDPTAAAGVTGEVVWSEQAQSGFMRFSGLAANDPSEFQYQLWIFDAERDERFPVDGGVFDIPEGADEVIVPIDARLPVGQVTLFAVTVEEPGGVVVSDRSRIAVVAQAE